MERVRVTSHSDDECGDEKTVCCTRVRSGVVNAHKEKTVSDECAGDDAFHFVPALFDEQNALRSNKQQSHLFLIVHWQT